MSLLLTAPGDPSPRRRWTTAEFDRLVAVGVIREGSRAYLWDGEIIEPMAEEPPHINAVENLRNLLTLPPADWTVNQGHPLLLADGFQPQPDLLVLRGPRSLYRGRKPAPADVALLIEVSDSTYVYDAGDYLLRYARAGIPWYWIVNLRDARVEVYSGPTHAGYANRRDYPKGTAVPLEGLAPLREIAVDAILADS